MATIRLARQLQGLGMTLDEVADAPAAHDRGNATCQSERWRLKAILAGCDSGHCGLRSPRRPNPTT